jgi:hypothetical protein
MTFLSQLQEMAGEFARNAQCQATHLHHDLLEIERRKRQMRRNFMWRTSRTIALRAFSLYWVAISNAPVAGLTTKCAPASDPLGAAPAPKTFSGATPANSKSPCASRATRYEKRPRFRRAGSLGFSHDVPTK